MTSRYEVVFEDDGGEVMSHEYTAADEDHAKDLARHQYPHAVIESVYELPETPRHPEIEVSAAHVKQHPLTSVRTALRIAGVSTEEIREFTNESLNSADTDEGPNEIAKKWVTIK